MELKIGTYNVCHCRNFENYSNKGNDIPEIVDIQKTAQTIKSLGLDVIGLNEVYDDGKKDVYVNQTKRLAELAGYEYYAFATPQAY